MLHRALALFALASLCHCRPIVVRDRRATHQRAPVQARVAPTTIHPLDDGRTVERWRRRWSIDEHFVVERASSMLVRRNQTSEIVTFSLYDRETGALQRALPWLSTALPLAHRSYTDRFTFGGPWVSVIESEPPTQTAVRALETGALAWSRPWPSSVALFDGNAAPFAFVIDHQRSVLGVADAATGAWRWSAPAQPAQSTLVAVTAAAALTFEWTNSDRGQPGTLTARSLRDGAVLWSERSLNLPHAPVHVRSTVDHTVVAQNNAFSVRATRDGRPISRASVEQRIDGIALVQGVVVVTSLRGIDAFAADSGALLWRRDGRFDCIYAAHESVFVVAANAEWRELAARTGALLFELGGGRCGWETNVWSRGEGTLFVREAGELVAHERTDAPLAIAPLRVFGTVTLEGAIVAGVRVFMGARETVTDAQGRYEFTLQTRGTFGVYVDEQAMSARAPDRCLTGSHASDHFEYDGAGGERRADLTVETREPNPLTRCSPM